MFRCVFLDWLKTQVSRKASVSRSLDLLQGKHLRCLVCLRLLNGSWMDITPVPAHCALFLAALSCPLLIMSHPEIVYIGFFWFLWFAMLNRCLWAKSSSSEGFNLCALTGVSASACSSSERARPDLVVYSTYKLPQGQKVMESHRYILGLIYSQWEMPDGRCLGESSLHN